MLNVQKRFAWVAMIFGTILGGGVAHSASTAEHRDLIALISVSELGPSGLRIFFKAEENKAFKRTESIATGHYRNVKIFFKEEATLENFLDAIQESESDPQVKDIDAVIYLHGLEGSLGFLDYPDFISTETVAKKVRRLRGSGGKGPTKLRALYSDACYGNSHADDWIHAGFRVVAGGIGEDTNKSADYGRFLSAWVEGDTFRASIAYANETWINRISDGLQGGDSFKVVTGNGNLSIDE